MIARARAAALALWWVLGALGAAAAPPEQRALESLAGPLYRELAALKGVVAPGAPPPVRLASRAEMGRFIDEELARRYPPERLEAERKGMVAWGLIPAAYDLRRSFVDLAQEQIAAYYDPRGRVMVVGDWLDPEAQASALAHELVHALQDREIPLDAFLAPVPGRGDEMLARQALIEGEAVALTLALGREVPGGGGPAPPPDVAAVRAAIAAGTAGPVAAAAPPFLRDLLLFPYIDGLAFVLEVRAREPAGGASALYRDPPRSTAQILAPAKRLVRREDPLPVALPDLDRLLPRARVVAEDDLGEFGLAAVIGASLDEDTGRAAARGWRGDRYRIWEDGAGRLTLAYRLAMADAGAAAAFARLYERVMERRHPVLDGRRRVTPARALATWRDGDRAFAVERRGAEVLVLENVPAAAARPMREAIWRSPTPGAPSP